MSNPDLNRRIELLENSNSELNNKIGHLLESTARLTQMVEIHANLAPEVHQLRVDLSNAKLIQKGFVWVTGVVATSGISIAVTFIAERFM